MGPTTRSTTVTSTRTLTEELNDLFEEMYAALITGDVSTWAARMSARHEPLGIGTDPHEFWVGRDRIAQVTGAQVEEMSAAGIRFVAGDIRTHSVGEVAWGVDQPTLRMPDGTQVPMRLTVVAVDEDGELRWTQFHLSMGVPNGEALQQDLTT